MQYFSGKKKVHLLGWQLGCSCVEQLAACNLGHFGSYHVGIWRELGMRGEDGEGSGLQHFPSHQYLDARAWLGGPNAGDLWPGVFMQAPMLVVGIVTRQTQVSFCASRAPTWKTSLWVCDCVRVGVLFVCLACLSAVCFVLVCGLVLSSKQNGTCLGLLGAGVKEFALLFTEWWHLVWSCGEQVWDCHEHHEGAVWVNQWSKTGPRVATSVP